jgi:hypothetical protein
MPSSPSFIPLRVKSSLPQEIAAWYEDLNLEKVRVRRPSKFLFLCGGAQEPNNEARAANLRDYLLRVRPIKTKHSIVLAEEANQLYRDTGYNDLISFEEDIARIAAIVLVIAESAGSLAELGAFTANDTIRKALRVVIPSHHEVAESFVRYGPIERLKKENRENLGVYPWTQHATGKLNVSSAKPHYRELVSFINGHLDAVGKSTLYRKLDAAENFYTIYWVIHLSIAISTRVLQDCIRLLVPGITDTEIRNKIFCMQLAKWIGRLSYSGKDYFFALVDDEPFDYSYKSGVNETLTVRRKMVVHEALRKTEIIPKYVLKQAASARVAKL